MSEKITLALENRGILGKKVKNLRHQGILPATVYGKNVGPFPVQLPLRTFQEAYRRASRTKIIELTIPGQPLMAAFVHALQRHPVSREIIHVDFRAVDLKVAVTMGIPLHFVGSSALVQRGEAVLNHVLTTIDVSALPSDLPSSIEVDISSLDSFDKTIHVRDLIIPAGTTIITDLDELVTSLTVSRTEAEEATETTGASAEPELVREKREEDE